MTSTYNRRGLLARALASARRQRLVDVEIVVVDNGSADDTSAMVRDLGDPRVRLLRNDTSLGPVGGRNTGLAAAAGDWVALLDDDDLWAPEKLAAQLAAVEASGRVWAYSGCVYIDSEGALLGGTPPPSPEETQRLLPVRYVVPGALSGMLWRRGALDGDGLLDPELTYTTDWDVSLRLLRVGPPAAVARPHVAYRLHGLKVSARADERRHEYDRIAHKHADLRGARPLEYAAHDRYMGSEFLRSGHRRAAAASYARAVRAGDRSSIARLASVALPAPLRRRVVRRLRGDPDWLAEARTWLADLEPGLSGRAESPPGR